MGQENVALYAFNRGRISRLALARTDVKRAAFSADLMENWMPRVMGAMSLRAGLGYRGALAGAPRYIPFVFATADTAVLEFTNGKMRVWVDDALVTRASVTTAVTNGSFDTTLASWTDNDEAGGASAWVAGGYMGLTGNGTAAAIRDQQVSVAVASKNVEHALRIVVQRGPVMLRVGSSSGGDDYVTETELGTGTHSLAFTPTGDFFIHFFSRLKRQVLIDSCNVEAAGVMEVTSPYTTSDLGNIRFDQSADVVYLACAAYQQRKVERRSTTSWSIVRFQVNDGPFRIPNTGPTTITASAISGNVTLTASAALFRSSHATSTNNDGAIFRITSNGQVVNTTVNAQNTFTSAIRVEGVGVTRTFTYVATGLSATGSTITIQRSLSSDSGPWTDVVSLVADALVTYTDGLDNQIAWYRIGCKTGDYVAGSIGVSLNYTVGSINGYARVTGFTSSTQVSAEVMTDLGGTDATDDWAEGEWSDSRGWPSANSLAEGRLWWFGKQGIWGSISDGFESHDENFEGDAGAINREIGSGPFDTVNWALALSRLIAGGQAAEYSLKSSTLDEPLTPTNFNMRADSTQGSAEVQAVKNDKKGAFVQRGGTRVFELDRGDGVDYDARDLTILIPEICKPAVSRMAIQRQPDTRIHCVLTDGTVALAVIDRVEGVLCWFKVVTRDDDAIVDVVVLPGADGDGEDAVYYAVQRSINGSTVYYHEKWALEEECIGETLNKQADAFVEYTQAASSTITGLSHLIGCEVVVWDNGKCLRDEDDEIATFTVDASGHISVTNAGVAYLATTGIVGLSYAAPWKSTKLAYAAQGGSALNQRKKFDHLGVILDRTHHRGLKYGPDFDNLSSLPLVEQDEDVAEDTIHEHYDEDPFEFEGEWKADSRLCLQAQAPRPCTILAATLPIEERGKK